MTIESYLPTVISLAVTIPVTLLTTFVFNERLKNKRVTKDILIENLKELLSAVHAENEQLINLAGTQIKLQKQKETNLREAFTETGKRKQEILDSLFTSHAKINSHIDLIKIQAKAFATEKNRES